MMQPWPGARAERRPEGSGVVWSGVVTINIRYGTNAEWWKKHYDYTPGFLFFRFFVVLLGLSSGQVRALLSEGPSSVAAMEPSFATGPWP